MQSFLQSSKLKVNFNLLNNDFINIKDFETKLWDAIYNKQEICESMRFTIGSQTLMNPFGFLCKALEEMMTICYLQKNFKLTFWVAEEFPVYLTGKSAEEISKIHSMLLTSLYNIKKSKMKTCKGISININLTNSLKKVSYKKILKQIKQIRRN